MDLTELALLVGRVDEKTDTIITNTADIKAQLIAHGERLEALEGSKKVWKAIWAIMVSVVSFGFKKG